MPRTCKGRSHTTEAVGGSCKDSASACVQLAWRQELREKLPFREMQPLRQERRVEATMTMLQHVRRGRIVRTHSAAHLERWLALERVRVETVASLVTKRKRQVHL